MHEIEGRTGRIKETPVATNDQFTLEPWGVAIVEENITPQ